MQLIIANNYIKKNPAAAVAPMTVEIFNEAMLWASSVAASLGLAPSGVGAAVLGSSEGMGGSPSSIMLVGADDSGATVGADFVGAAVGDNEGALLGDDWAETTAAKATMKSRATATTWRAIFLLVFIIYFFLMQYFSV